MTDDAQIVGAVTEVRIVDAEAIKVGPDEVLILRVKGTGFDQEFMGSLSDALEDIGLQGRALVIGNDDVEFAVVKR